jgi:DNA polymerase
LRWTRITAPEEFAKFDAYNVQDIVTEGAISLMLPDLPPRELEIWQMDQRVNRRGMQIDVRGVANCISIVEQCTDKYNAELRYITGGQVSEYTKAADTVAWLKTQGLYLHGLDEEIVTEELKRNHEPAIHRVLQIRNLLSFGSVKKLYAMRAQTCADGRLRDQYAYHGAHTSLWNGQNVQPANLYKGKLDKPEKVEAALAVIASGSLDYVEGVYGDALEIVADCLRSMIIAPPGKDLIAADYTAIQAVVTGALAGEDWRTEVFRTHGKIYEAMAAELTGKTLQFYIDYKKQNGKHHDDRNPYGKIPVLASDFGAWIPGWKRFGAEIYGDDQAIKQKILSTRAKIPAIVEMWGGQVRNKFRDDERPELYGLEGAAVAAVLNPGKCYGYRGMRYQMHGDALYCQPPTDGAPIIYHEPRLEPSKREWSRPYELSLSYIGWNSNQTKGKGGWVRMSLYGGVLTQNLVAKVAREFQANALVALDKTGLYLPVMHTHDEQVTEVPEGLGSTDEYLTIVNRIPAWAYHWDGQFKGQPWPIKAPGAERTKRYGKWE